MRPNTSIQQQLSRHFHDRLDTYTDAGALHAVITFTFVFSFHSFMSLVSRPCPNPFHLYTSSKICRIRHIVRECHPNKSAVSFPVSSYPLVIHNILPIQASRHPYPPFLSLFQHIPPRLSQTSTLKSIYQVKVIAYEKKTVYCIKKNFYNTMNGYLC